MVVSLSHWFSVYRLVADHIGNITPNTSSLLECVLVAEERCLLRRFLAMTVFSYYTTSAYSLNVILLTNFMLVV
jgi:hypothetical protein